MKKLMFTICLLIGSVIISNKSFAQRDAGGSSGGTGVPPQPCPTEFTRNNGDGTCGGSAQIRLYFTTAPAYAPDLEDIIYNGQSLFTNPTPISGNVADLATLGYISYCLPLSNIPPAVKLTVVFRYTQSVQNDCILSGTN